MNDEDTVVVEEPAPRPRRKTQQKPAPTHYKVVCISMYTEDLKRANDMVAMLKAAGHYKMSFSQLIRIALARLDPETIERELGESR